jgi:hypothetical protein
MASRTATVQAVNLVRGPDDAYGNEAAGYTVHSAEISLWNNTSSTVAGGTDTLDCNLATAIEDARRDGKTVTIRSMAVVGAAVVGGTSYAASHAVSTNTIQLTPKTSDWSTNATLPANTSTTQRYYRVVAGYTVA